MSIKNPTIKDIDYICRNVLDEKIKNYKSQTINRTDQSANSTSEYFNISSNVFNKTIHDLLITHKDKEACKSVLYLFNDDDDLCDINTIVENFTQLYSPSGNQTLQKHDEQYIR
jgi:hypothetical protein